VVFLKTRGEPGKPFVPADCDRCLGADDEGILIAVILTMGGYAPAIFRRDGMAAA
jgi:hypothetical protein